MPTTHQAPLVSQMWRSAGERLAAAGAARDLVLDDAEVRSRQRVDVALERQRPVLGRPLSHVVEPVGELLGRDPIRVLQHDVGADVDPPGVVLVAPRAPPDRGVVLIHRRSDGDRRGKAHAARDVIEETVTHAHGFYAPAVPALQSLDREPVFSRLAKVVRRADDHPVLGGPTATRLALPPRAPGLGRSLLIWLGGLWSVRHRRKITYRSRRPGAAGPGPAVPEAERSGCGSGRCGPSRAEPPAGTPRAASSPRRADL